MLSSDGKVLLLKQADKHLGLSKTVSEILPDKRVQNKITHLHRDWIFQKCYALYCGYKTICDYNALCKNFLL